MFQLPNWVEAGITFWAAAYLGAVVVPVVHFYGPKEVGYILRATEPAVVITPDRFGHTDHVAMYDELLAAHPDTHWLDAIEHETAELAVAVAAARASKPARRWKIRAIVACWMRAQVPAARAPRP